MHHGTVFWITGLSGAGKTTLGRLLYDHLSHEKSNVVFLDGDILREVFGNDLGHSLEERHRSAMRNARLCKMLSEQGIDVVCSTISLFHSCQKWNRENITNYKEIFIDVPEEVLHTRDPKGLYKAALTGNGHSIVGLDVKCERPINPDMTINNDGTRPPTEVASAMIAQLLKQ